jgi:CRP-like cAMP-binding protein
MVALLDADDAALFPKLTEEQLEFLRPLGQVREVEADEVLFRDGDAAYDPMVVLAGEVVILAGSGADARELVVQLPGDLMVELNLFTGQPVGATAIVRTAGRVLVVSADEFRSLVGRELVFGDFVLQLLFRRRQALERLLLGIRIVGSRFDRDTHRLREFAARNHVAHEWIESDDARASSALRQLELPPGAGPVVLLGGTRVMRNPDNAELADALGLHQTPAASETTFDLVVVGAGPAGLAAAVYGASSGLSTAVLDAVGVGGQAAASARIENYLGFPAGISGAELAERGRIQADKFGARFLVPRRAVGLSERDGSHVIELDNGDALQARALILALGVQYRRLPIPGLASYEGLGVAYATDSAREQLRPETPPQLSSAAPTRPAKPHWHSQRTAAASASSSARTPSSAAWPRTSAPGSSANTRSMSCLATRYEPSRAKTTSSRWWSKRRRPAGRERSPQAPWSSSSAPPLTPTGSQTHSRSTRTEPSSPERHSAQGSGIKPPGTGSDAIPSCSRQAPPASSPSATSVPAQPEWPPPQSAKAAWPFVSPPNTSPVTRRRQPARPRDNQRLFLGRGRRPDDELVKALASIRLTPLTSRPAACYREGR